MIRKVTAVNLLQSLGEMLNHVQYRNDSIVIQRDGEPVAALVNSAIFARIRRRSERFEALSRRIKGAYAGTPLEEGLLEIDSAVARERTR